MIRADLKLKYLGFIPRSSNNRPLSLIGTENDKNSSSRNEATSTDKKHLWRASLQHTANIMVVYTLQIDTLESMSQPPYAVELL